MTEEQLLRAVTDAARYGGGLVYHTRDSRRSEPGWPDVAICGPKGLLLRELKTDRGRVTKEQQKWLEMLCRAGADADVWRPNLWPGVILHEMRGIGLNVRGAV